MRRLVPIVSTVAVLGAVSLGVPPAASAAPPPFEGLPVTCEQLGNVVLVSPGADGVPFTPAFIAGTHQLLVPYEVAYTAYVDGMIVSHDSVKSAPVPAETTACEFDHTYHFGDQTIRLVGSITGVVVGQP
jgi:hypothetical protein